MIIGPRPSLGWVVYLAMAGSWYRVAAVLGILGLLMLFAVREGSHTLTIQYNLPPPFPPPVMFVPTPSHGHLTALDACSVEAAGVRDGQVGVGSEQGLLGGRVGRQVYVYLWGSSVGPRDVWAQWLASLPGAHLVLLDLPRTVSKTPLENLAKFTGRTAPSSEWEVWAGARVAVLWAAGGLALPLGVVATRPVLVEAVGPGSGVVVVADSRFKFDPVVLAAPAQHPLLTTIAQYLDNGNSGGNHFTNQGELLTEAMKDMCGVESLRLLPVSDCHEFTLLPADAVHNMDLDKTPQAGTVPTSAMFLRCTSESCHLGDPAWTFQLFHSYQLAHYCPQTAKQVKLMYSQYL